MIYFIVSVLIVIVDFIVKKCSLEHLTKVDTSPLWKDVFHLTYVENKGAAFGMMQNQRWFFIVLTVIVLIGVIVFAFKLKKKHPALLLALAFLSGGAVGNLIDRIFYGFVVDLFDFRLINFPVFNVADIFVVVGAMLIAVYYIFFDKEEKENQ